MALDLKLILANAISKEFAIKKMIEVGTAWLNEEDEDKKSVLFFELANTAEIVLMKDLIDKEGLTKVKQNLDKVDAGFEMMKNLDKDIN